MPVFLHGDFSTQLPPMRLVSRASQEYAGACPFCGGDERTSDRFHIWLLPAGRERYWCRRCNRQGTTADLLGDAHAAPFTATHPPDCPDAPLPQAAHIPYYRQLYALVAHWAEVQLHQPWNPEPLAYLEQRGFDRASLHWARLGYALADPTVLVNVIRQHDPTLLPYAVEAGLLIPTVVGTFHTHRNLCGRIVIPYLSRGEVYDLRTRRWPGTGYTSLRGSYTARGATIPFGWDDTQASEVVLITEGELKALAVMAAYRNGALPYPAISHPGLSYFRPAWATALARQGTRVAIMAYDARATRPCDAAGNEQLAPEELWTIRHGRTLAAAGLQVFVLNLPLAAGAAKEDLDGFLLAHSPAALTWLLHTTVRSLEIYIAQLPPDLIHAARLDRPAPH